MYVAIPEEVDITYVRKSNHPTDLTENSITVQFREHVFGPYPTKTAFTEASARLVELFPSLFIDEKSTQTAFMVLHFMYMSMGCNKAGEDYPIRS